MIKKNATIYDIAKHLDISPATVSRAINNDLKISNETISKVRNAVRNFGYVPKPVHQRQGRRSSGLASGKAKSPNIIFLHKGKSIMWGEIFQLMEEYLAEHGFSIENKYYSSNVSLDKADGVIVDFTLKDKHLIKLLRQKNTVQMFGHPYTSDILWDQITYDNSRVGMIAAKYLMSKGHEVMAAFYPENEVAQMRAEAFIKTVRDAKKRVKRYAHPEFEIDIEMLEDQVKQINSLISKPTGMFAFNDITAVSLHVCMLKFGIVPGKDAEIIACDNIRNILSTVNPRPATIEIHPSQIAKRAVEQLIWRFNNPYEQTVTIIIEPELITNERIIK